MGEVDLSLGVEVGLAVVGAGLEEGTEAGLGAGGGGVRSIGETTISVSCERRRAGALAFGVGDNDST